jgi:hypothetical protein
MPMNRLEISHSPEKSRVTDIEEKQKTGCYSTSDDSYASAALIGRRQARFGSIVLLSVSTIWCGFRQRQPQPEMTSGARCAFHVDVTAVSGHQVVRDGQTQPHAGLLTASLLAPVKGRKDVSQVLRSYTGAGVAYADPDAAGIYTCGYSNLATSRSIFDGVAEDVP